MEIKIYGEIGVDTTALQVLEAINNAGEDTDILIKINSIGGDVAEAWAIYDALRTSGKNVFAVVEGTAYSAASLIYMAAPKSNRTIKRHASILIHNPYSAAWGYLSAEQAVSIGKDLLEERDRYAQLYADRTGLSVEDVKDLMDREEKIDAEKALELGFAVAIIEENTAKDTKSNNNINQKIKKMALSFSTRLKAAKLLGLRILAMELKTNSGETLVVERESGDVVVGDVATPDGRHEMPDGKVIVVENGVVTEVVMPENGGEKTIDDLRRENEELRKRVEELERKMEEIRPTEEENVVLAAVKAMGGIETLKAMVSDARMPTRENKAEKPATLAELVNKQKKGGNK